MYAPKFRSWMTEEERFMESLSYRLDIMADDAHSEIRKMAEDAMPKEPERPKQPLTQDALLALYQKQAMNMGPAYGPNHLQADPWNVPYHGGLAGGTLRDLFSPLPNPWHY